MNKIAFQGVPGTQGLTGPQGERVEDSSFPQKLNEQSNVFF